MRVTSFLVPGDGTAVASSLAPLASKALNALLLLSLGADHAKLTQAVASFDCPVYLTETYGIIGYDAAAQRSIELMEKGRGSEYGFRGGSGGQGCLVIAYSEGARAGHTADFPTDASSLLVLADTSKAFAKVAASAPLHYGGITKEAFVLTSDGAKEQVPFFWVASQAGSSPVGVSTFTGEAGSAAQSLLDMAPSGYAPDAVGLFPCFTRGVNQYGAENVETDAIRAVLDSAAAPRIYGMFAHGELGPSSYSGFSSDVQSLAHEQHSMTSILAVHTIAGSAARKDEV